MVVFQWSIIKSKLTLKIEVACFAMLILKSVNSSWIAEMLFCYTLKLKFETSSLVGLDLNLNWWLNSNPKQTTLTLACVFVYFSASVEFGNLDESSLVQTSGGDLSAEDRELLKAYHHSFDDEKVDLDLIMRLLYNICHNCDAGRYIYTLPRTCCGFSFWWIVLFFQ